MKRPLIMDKPKWLINYDLILLLKEYMTYENDLIINILPIKQKKNVGKLRASYKNLSTI